MQNFIRNKIPVSISISPMLLIQIDKAIQSDEISRSDFIRRAIMEKLAKDRKNENETNQN